MSSLRRARPRRSRLSLLVLALAAMLLAPTSALAVNTYSLDVKAHPSVFKENTEVEVPLYFVENRAPDVDTSRFSQYPAGLRSVWFDIGSVQSRFVEFTPAPAFDGRGFNNPSAEGFDVYTNKIRLDNGRSRLYVVMYATRGAAATVDGSGITGRTELLLGTLRIAVGAHANVANGQKIVLDYIVGDDASSSDPGFDWWRALPDSQGKGWGITGGTGITWPKQTRVFWDGSLENEGEAPGDGDPQPQPQPQPNPNPQPTNDQGPQAPGVSSLGYSGKLKKSKKASKSPFTVLSKKPKKGTPAVKITVTAGTKVTATLAKVGKKQKLTNLKGERIFEVDSIETYLKLTGSWNKKALAKGIYRLTLRSPNGVPQTVEFKVT